MHFRKDTGLAQPRVLLAAPMAGHFPTLLRHTAQTLLADHDVYITDWKSGRDVPLSGGRFGTDEYIDHLMAFFSHIGPGAHGMAVCQPCPLHAGDRGADGGRQPSGHAQKPDADGGAGGHLHQSHQGQPAGQ